MNGSLPHDGDPEARQALAYGGALSSRVIRCAIEVHRHLGPGLLKAVYEECLIAELIGDGSRTPGGIPRHL